MAMGLASAGRRGRRARRTPMAEINVTPLVDVMLVLLIIFMVTAPLLTAAVPIDLPDSRADAQGWRHFLEGQRSGAQALGDIGDPAALDTAAMLMREDEVFRDAGHHFLRQYDRALSRAAAGMDDPALAAAADTRSGRAFRLLAQVTGMFG